MVADHQDCKHHSRIIKRHCLKWFPMLALNVAALLQSSGGRPDLSRTSRKWRSRPGSESADAPNRSPNEGLRHAVYSALIFASFTILAHFSVSAAMNFPKSPG